MRTHPLKVLSLASILALIASQLSLALWLDNPSATIIALVLTAPLVIPLKGMFGDRRYTFKWVGFLPMLYLAIGISESFSNPELRVYGILTIAFSSLLFFSSIYYSRVLR